MQTMLYHLVNKALEKCFCYLHVAPLCHPSTHQHQKCVDVEVFLHSIKTWLPKSWWIFVPRDPANGLSSWFIVFSTKLMLHQVSSSCACKCLQQTIQSVISLPTVVTGSWKVIGMYGLSVASGKEVYTCTWYCKVLRRQMHADIKVIAFYYVYNDVSCG